MMRITIALLLLSTLVVTACRSASADAQAEAAALPATVFLVRHAETDGGGPAPALSEAGRARAERLAGVLATESITRVLTTDYQRTRGTAGPVAARLGITAETYDPRDLQGLAEKLRTTGGRVLVVGHSNTTPALVTLLGGEPGSAIAETEHDRLYRVDLNSGRTSMQRY